MSRNRPNKTQPAGRGLGRAPRPAVGGRSIRNTSLLLLVGVVFIVALLMVVSLAGFVLKPDPAVKAGPMYVTLALTTGATLLMLILALNASFLPVISHARERDLQLVMWAMGVTGVVTGLLTVGDAARPAAMRFVLGAIAFVFITVQHSRLARARGAGTQGQTPTPARQQQAHSGGRQRRGGRKR